MVKEVRVSWEGMGRHSSSFHSEFAAGSMSEDWEPEAPEETDSNSSAKGRQQHKKHLADADWLKSTKPLSGKKTKNPKRKAS